MRETAIVACAFLLLAAQAHAGPIAESLARGDVLEPVIEQIAADDSEMTRRVLALEDKLQRVELIADATASCIQKAFMVHGSDLVSTGWALDRCPTCAEANPLGVNVEARVGLKLGALGYQVWECYHAAKKNPGHTSIGTHANRIITMAVVFMNFANAIKGTPLIRWGTPKE